MKRLLIVCGTGIATSTVVTQKVSAWLEKKGLTNKVIINQSSITDSLYKLNEYDVILSTTVIANDMENHVIDAVPLLIGSNEEIVFKQIQTKISS